MDLNERQNCGMNQSLQEQISVVNSGRLIGLIENNRAFSGTTQSRNKHLLEQMQAVKNSDNSSRLVLAAQDFSSRGLVA